MRLVAKKNWHLAFYAATRPILVALFALLIAPAARMQAVDFDFQALEPMLALSLTPEGQEDLKKAADAPLLRIDVTLDVPEHALHGRVRILYTNRTASPLDSIGFHLFPNAKVFHSASMTVEAVRIDGAEAAERTLVNEDSGLIVRLMSPLACGAKAMIDLDYRAAISTEHGDHGLFSYADGVYSLYGWYPEPAVFSAGEWQLHPLNELADPTQSEMSHVVVTFTAPADIQVISSGSQIDRRLTADGATETLTISSAFTRDLALIAGTGFEHGERQVGETLVSSWWRGDDQPGGRRVLSTACESLALYNERFGHYPYAELDAVEVPLGDFVGGMESTALVLIDDQAYAAVRWLPDSAREDVLPVFEMSIDVSHEVGHQYWYNLVGSDSWLSPWQDESLTNWTCCYFLEQRRGLSVGAGAWGTCFMEASPKESMSLATNLDAGSYNLQQYGGIIYGRGALMYQALRHEVGDDLFMKFLRTYLARYRYAYIDESAWQQTLAEVIGAERAEVFRDKWLKAEGLTLRDLGAATRQTPPAHTTLAPVKDNSSSTPAIP